jgi:hypothetical protein
MDLKININSQFIEADVAARLNLADFIRHELGLTGTHVGCEHGVCGACTVLVNGEAVRSCLMLAIQANGQKIITISNLRSALARVDLIHTEDDLVNMLRLNDNGKTIDFQGFFNLFMETQVSNLRECLQEWLYQATL